ncbi:hypothetical protein LSH36_672g00012 [Paralvinella palmiformis]|uniref:Uncharacterized protein n=1 Tax=Paralvinella palmiformis TaxID=53620 RepID=A0AAD9MVP5_9ANNE|nr:hypothetical protein LSH36_672g00012 [Paralvinella palmiformis]
MCRTKRSGSTYVSHLFKDTSLLHKERNVTDRRRTSVVIDHIMNVDTNSQSDHVFFLYEPLDPLYTAMFGTQQAWNTGGDIFSYENGTLRTLPKYELTAITWYLNKIFQCQMADLPPGVLMHKFWNAFRGSMPLVHQYASCVSGLTGLVPEKWHLENDKCQKHVRHICGVHFGQKRHNQEHVCRKNLWGLQLDPGNYQPNAVRYASGLAPYPDSIKFEFQSYFRCLAQYRNVTQMCAGEFFDKPCRMASIRAIKTVRATMEAARYFRERYDNFRVIHSFRQQRASATPTPSSTEPFHRVSSMSSGSRKRRREPTSSGHWFGSTN